MIITSNNEAIIQKTDQQYTQSIIYKIGIDTISASAIWAFQTSNIIRDIQISSDQMKIYSTLTSLQTIFQAHINVADGSIISLYQMGVVGVTQYFSTFRDATPTDAAIMVCAYKESFIYFHKITYAGGVPDYQMQYYVSTINNMEIRSRPHIQDQNTAQILLFGPYVSLTNVVWIAQLDFLNQKQTLKLTLPAFPNSNNVWLGILVSPALFYIPVSYNAIFLDAVPTTQIIDGSLMQGFIFSNKQPESCMFMSGKVEYIKALTMNTLQFRNSDDINTSTKMNFFTDIGTTLKFTDSSTAYTKVELVPSKFSSTSWCQQIPFSYVNVKQTATNLQFKIGVINTLSITKFSATVECGPYTKASIEYYGTQSDFAILPSWITISPTTGDILVADTSSPGKIDIIVSGFITEYNVKSYTYSQTFTLESTTNFLPVFTAKLQDQTVEVGQSIVYKVPCSDADGTSVTIKTSTGGIITTPSYLSISGDELTINPTSSLEIGKHLIEIQLYDNTIYSTQDTMNIIIIEAPPPPAIIKGSTFGSDSLLNSGPPIFSEAQKSLQIQSATVTEYTLPNIIDPDNDEYDIQVTLGEAMTFTDYNSMKRKFIFSPIESNVKATPYQIDIEIKDRNVFTKSSKYTLQVEVTSNKTDEQKSEIVIPKPNEEKVKEKTNNQIIKEKVNIKINRVTQDGIVKIKVYSNSLQASKQLLANINADNLKLFLTKSYSGVVEELKFTIINEPENLQLKMSFGKPEIISNSQDLDIIEARIQAHIETEIKDSSGSKTFYIEKGTIASAKIPQQISNEEIELQQRISNGIYITQMTMISSSVVLNIFLQLFYAQLLVIRSMFLQLIWNFLNDISFLMVLSMISIRVPGIASTIQGTILNFVYLDFLQTDKWLSNLLPRDGNDEEQISPYFEKAGFQSNSFILNLGSTFVYIAILGFLYALLPIFIWLSQCSRISGKVRDFLKQHLIWNAPIRFILQQFSSMIMAGCISIQYVSFESTSSTLSFIMNIAICLPSLAIQFILIKKALQGDKTEQFAKQFGTLIQGQNLNTSIGLIWNCLIQLRWLIVSVLVAFLQDHAQLQIMLFLPLSWCFQSLIIIGKPMQGMLENRMALLNEFMVSLYLYQLIALTDVNPDETIIKIAGWTIIATVLASITANLAKLTIEVFQKSKTQLIAKRNSVIAAFNQTIKQQTQLESFTKKEIVEDFDDLTFIASSQQKQLKPQQQSENFSTSHFKSRSQIEFNSNLYNQKEKTQQIIKQENLKAIIPNIQQRSLISKQALANIAATPLEQHLSLNNSLQSIQKKNNQTKRNQSTTSNSELISRVPKNQIQLSKFGDQHQRNKPIQQETFKPKKEHQEEEEIKTIHEQWNYVKKESQGQQPISSNQQRKVFQVKKNGERDLMKYW